MSSFLKSFSFSIFSLIIVSISLLQYSHVLILLYTFSKLLSIFRFEGTVNQSIDNILLFDFILSHVEYSSHHRNLILNQLYTNSSL